MNIAEMALYAAVIEASAVFHDQNDFAALVERVDQQKQTIQQSLEKLELMKKALMQEYFG